MSCISHLRPPQEPDPTPKKPNAKLAETEPNICEFCHRKKTVKHRTFLVFKPASAKIVKSVCLDEVGDTKTRYERDYPE